MASAAPRPQNAPTSSCRDMVAPPGDHRLAPVILTEGPPPPAKTCTPRWLIGRRSAATRAGASLLLRAEQALPLLLLLVPVGERDALLHPLRGRLAVEVVLEELEHPHRVVALARLPPQPVRLAVVVQEVALLAQPSEGEVVLDPLVPRHRVVLVVVQHQERRLHPVG